MTNDVKDQLTKDHAQLYDTLVARRYFVKFDRITGHLQRVAGELETEGTLTRTETRVLGRYLTALGATFQALSHKYLMTGRADGVPRLTFDRHESGFPVAQELMVMALDAHGAIAGLASSLGGTLQMLAGGVMVVITGLFFDGTALPMVAAIALCAVAALLLALRTFAIMGRAAVSAA